MKVVFLSTPKFGVKPLTEIHRSRHEVIAVISQPDRAFDRKGRLVPTPVKQAARELGLDIYQFDSVNHDGVPVLKALNADVFITAAYGQILKEEILKLPKFGVINAHASLLPLYRGASPIQSAILDGQTETGVTIMQTDLGLDTGDILDFEKIQIHKEDTTESLTDKLSELSAKLLLKTLDDLEKGRIKRIPQDNALHTKCMLITKQMGLVDFSNSSERIFNQIRAVPSFACLDGMLIKILACEVADTNSSGKIGLISGDFIVQCGRGSIKITYVLPENKKRLSAREFIMGYNPIGKIFGKEESGADTDKE